MVLALFTKCAIKARANIENGGKVTCTMDEWIKQMVHARRHTEQGGDKTDAPLRIRDFTNYEIAQTVFTFLFASQDATSSALTFLFQIVADRPDVMSKLREEQIAVRDGDKSMKLSVNLLDKMIYTRAVVKELLRYRPPVLMVPYVAKKSFPVTPDYTVPKGRRMFIAYC